MPTSVFYRFNAFSENLAEGVHNLQTNQLTVALTNTAPSASNSVLADITQISYTNCSSRNVTTVSSSQTNGLYSLVTADLVLTASGGAVGPFRYVVLYNSTAANGPLIGYYDYGTANTIGDGETLTLDFASTTITITSP